MTNTNTQRGFTLIELVVAMTVTLIVVGAVYQLVTAGNNAFRREPEVSDRQQNIRIGLDLMAQDAYKAGSGMPRFAQVFTRALDGVGPLGPGGNDSDEFELISISDCGAEAVCRSDGVNVVTMAPLSSCYTFPVSVLLACETPTAASPDCPNYGVFWAEKPGAGSTESCSAAGGGNNGHVNLPPGQKPLLNPPGGPKWDPTWMAVGYVIRYRINPDANGEPNLERSLYGGQLMPDGSSSWQIIARGIEDLQVEYQNGAGWGDDPGAVTCGPGCVPDQAALDTVVRGVRIRLSARTVSSNLAGAQTSAVGNAIRGQLVTVVAPRSALATLGLLEH